MREERLVKESDGKYVIATVARLPAVYVCCHGTRLEADASSHTLIQRMHGGHETGEQAKK